jgi:hypothetical protein
MLLVRGAGFGLAAAVKVIFAGPVPLAAEMIVTQGSGSDTLQAQNELVTMPNGATPLPSALTLPEPGFTE